MTARRVALSVFVLAFAGTAMAQDKPSDNGRAVTAPQKSKDELLALLQSLQLVPRSPEEQKRLLDQFKNMPPEQRKMIEDWAAKMRSGDVPAGRGASPPPLPPGFDPGRGRAGPGFDPGRPGPGIEQLNPGAGQPELMQPMKPPAGLPAMPRPPSGTSNLPFTPAQTDPARADRLAQLGFDERGGAGMFRPNADDRLKDRPDVQKLIGFWEKNVAPLDRTPALKQAFIDIIQASEGKGTGPGGIDGEGGGFLSFLENQGGDVGEPGRWDWVEKSFEGTKWNLPELGLKDWGPKWSNPASNWNTPSAPPSAFGGGSGSGFGLPGIAGSVSPLLLLLVIAAAAFLVWRFWPVLRVLTGRKIDLSEKQWPFDPRSVSDREALVRAFEYISVQLCGDAARVWNHRTIAVALRTRVAGADAVSDELAGLYELARYTPPAEPLSPAALAAARRCLCHLAGVSPA